MCALCTEGRVEPEQSAALVESHVQNMPPAATVACKLPLGRYRYVEA